MPRVKAIRQAGFADVYNMEVENVYNFAVNGGLIVHNCDAIRYFAIYWTNPAPAAAEKRVRYRRDELEDYRNAKSQAERDIIIKRKGGKPL